jgi:putative membrane protein
MHSSLPPRPFRASYLEDPRVLFAAERTLLAWQRTAIALLGLGFAIEHFRPPSGMSLLLALALLVAAAAVALTSLWQYRRFVRILSEPELPPDYIIWPGTAINLLLSVIALGAAGWLGVCP